LAAIGAWTTLAHEYGGERYGSIVSPLLPPSLEVFIGVVSALTAIFGAAGFLALGRARCPAVWAAVSATVPVILLAVAYWRVTGLGVDLAWSAAAVALAALGLAAAAVIRRTPPRLDPQT